MSKLIRLTTTVLLFSLWVCVPAAAKDDDEGRSLWRAGEQYVRLAPAEEGAESNSHPAMLPPQDLRRLLAAAQTKERKAFFYFGTEDPIALFTPGMLDVLARYLSKGLAEATADEDVVFLLLGQYTQLSFFRNVHAVSARAFYRDGVLHLIFGDLLRPVASDSPTQYELRGLGDEQADRRTHPYKVGKRSREGAPGWEVVTAVAGMSRHSPADGKERLDWLQVDVAETLAALPLPEPEPAEAAKPAAAAAVPSSTTDRQMRLEMARMRQEIKALRDEGTTAAGMGSDVQQRMKILKILHEQELITDAEFRTKRAEILDEL